MFVAGLMNKATYEQDGKIYFIAHENLNDFISKLMKDRKFSEAHELIKAAKNLNNYDLSKSETSAKSFRVAFELYSKLLIISSMNSESLSDAIKRVLLPKLNSALEELQKTPGINVDKSNLIKAHLNDWSQRETGIRDSTPSVDLDEYLSEMEVPVKEYFLIVIRSEAQRLKSIASIVETFIEINTDPYFLKGLDCSLDIESGNLTSRLTGGYCYDEEMVIEYEESIGKSLGGLKGNAVEFFSHVQDLFYEISLGKYNLSFNELGKLFINGVELDDQESIKKMVFNELAYNYHPCANRNLQVSPIAVLPKNFDTEIYVKKVQTAILRNDYEEALKLSEKLEIAEKINKLSEKISEILNKLIKDSRVITINIPSMIISLLDLAKENKSYKEFVTEATEEYWMKLSIGGSETDGRV